MAFVEVIETAGKVIDATGVAVIVVGAVLAAVLTVTRRRQPDANAYEFFRRQLGGSILLGLEFLVAADIIRTVAIEPTPAQCRRARRHSADSDFPELLAAAGDDGCVAVAAEAEAESKSAE